MRLLLDEMHAPSIARALVGEGTDVLAVAAEASLRGSPDEDLLSQAADSGRALVTENVVDFSALADSWAVERRSHAGLVFTSPRRFNRASLAYPGDVIAALRQLVEASPIEGESWIWWL